VRRRKPPALPPTDYKYWRASGKAAIVEAVRIGALDVAEACSRYGLSIEEFTAWERDFARHGMRGLLVTKRVK
jgi:hypothetical protein